MKNLILFTLILLAGCDSTKHDYVTPPDQNLVFDKTITASQPRLAGVPIEFSVQFPSEFNHRKRWYFDYGHSIASMEGGNVLNYQYKKTGTYTIRVEGWNYNNTKMLLSNALKIQVR